MHVQQSLSGFIALTPQLSFTDRGDARFYAKIGQEHYTRTPDGGFTKQETTFHDLVMYRKSAERAYAQFAKGDKFVAEGYVREYEYQAREGNAVEGSEFIAKKLGHDVARTTYAVDRTRGTGPGVEHGIDASAPGRDQPAPPATEQRRPAAQPDSSISL